MTVNRRYLTFESLESRRVLAGNVAAAVTDGDLIITGNFAANHIEIYPYAPGGEVTANAYVIESRLDTSPTKINSQDSNFVAMDVTGDVIIRMRGSNDSVEIHEGEGDSIDFNGLVRFVGAAGNDRLFVNNANIPGDLTVFSGAGHDLVSLYQTNVEGETTVNTATGRDRVGMNAVDLGDAAVVNTGSGADRVGVHGSIFDTLELNAGGGGDVVGIGVDPAPLGVSWANLGVVNPASDDFGLEATGLQVNMGGGSDRLGVELSAVAVDAVFSTGGGLDWFAYQDNEVEGNVRILGGGARDRVSAQDNVVGGDLTIRLLGGNDRLDARNNEVTGSGLLHGGTGFDVLAEDGSNTFGVGPTVRSFERFV